MLKEPYTEKFYTYHSKYISNILALRPPQHESLEIFAHLCDVLSLSKEPDLNEELKAVNKLFPTLSSFERDFPSFCFALATGIGKTRLMGACIAYLRYEKGIKNFFVMAPNLTIYNKLKDDLGNPANKKYIFRGLDKFSNPPRIIDGDNYADFRQGTFGINDVVINVFNIAKLNSDSKVVNGAPARIKRLNEVLGESYFSYLQSLPDLCIFMDESHHYHADKSFEVINELKPILGVELTATPQIQKGAKKVDFKNVVYEYSLAHALNDGKYVKVPAVFTRKDFRPEEYTSDQLDREKLNDGIRLHEETKSHLEVYARTHGKPIIKPFVLVVAKDTIHSKQIYEYITSHDFFGGYYSNKVIEINSSQRGAEKDENIQQLLSLEKEGNTIEIVIHVNMLKEGWDVTNLYTIIPLRASASETLTEQTIGRGLRLPYGIRTNVEEVDRLSIVSHDKYEAIIHLANDPNSLVRKVYYIEASKPEWKDEQHETVELPTAYDDITTDYSFTEQLAFDLEPQVTSINTPEHKPTEQAVEVAKFVTKFTSQSVLDLNRQIKTFDAIHDEETRTFVQNTVVAETIRQFPEMASKKEEVSRIVEKAIDTCVQALTSKVIPIPQTIIQPFTEIKQGFYDFKLNTTSLNWHPSDDTLIGTELQEGGKTFEYESDFKAIATVDTAENEVIRHIVVHDNVDYMACRDLLYSLMNDAKLHFLSYLTLEETEKVIRDRQKTLADIIYSQMNQHFYKEEIKFRASEMRPFSQLEIGYGGKYKSDEIYDLRANIPASEVRKKIFNGFTKACHTLYKFDSDTERKFAIVLENDKTVQKWLRPAPKQFNIYYGSGGVRRYEPDFIVETETGIFMVETKASNETDDTIVQEKAKAATEYCKAVTEWNLKNGGKPWAYAIIAHDEVRLNSSFNHLMAYRTAFEQLSFDASQ